MKNESYANVLSFIKIYVTVRPYKINYIWFSGQFFQYLMREGGIFSSPELKAQVSFSDHPLSGISLSVCLSVRL
jgi:hypothetical protein